MSTFISLLRLLFFGLSILGYILYLCRKVRLRIEFAPVVVFGALISLIYIAGLLNVLRYACYAVFFGGIVLFVYSLIKKQMSAVFNRANITIGALSFIIALCFFTILLHDNRLSQYDDFSHWGIVVKDMLIYDRLPDAQSAIITFKTYPPASSLFVYFTCHIIGVSEGKMLIAQSYLMLACVFPIFGVIKNNKLSAVIALTASVFMVIGQRSFTALSVDTLLPLAGISATAIIYSFRSDLKKACLLVLPVLITMILIKNSGIFFAAINGVLLLYYAARYGKTASDKKETRVIFLYVFSTLLITAFMFFLWTQHLSFVFPGTVSKHSMSVENYTNVFNSKNTEDINNTINSFIKMLLNLNTISTQVMLLINAGILISVLLYRLAFKKRLTGMLRALLVSDILFIIYQVGNLVMYIFSMPKSEAATLNCYDRYVSSIIIYIFGLLVIGFSHDFDNLFLSGQGTAFKATGASIVLSVLLFATLLSSGAASIRSAETVYTSELPARLKSFVGNIDHYTTGSYLIYAPGQKSGYAYYMTMYMTFSPNVKELKTIPSQDKFLQTVSKYDYFIVLIEDKTCDELMSKYIDHPGSIGIYTVKETFFRN